MCSTELKSATDFLKKWFARKYKKRLLSSIQCQKNHFEMKNPVDWVKDKRVICNFPLPVGSLFGEGSDKITHYNTV